MTSDIYTSPVDKLLTYGELNPTGEDRWPNYLELGFTKEDVPELIRMATDRTLRHDVIDAEELDDAQELAFWAPLHAICVLGQLHAEEAIEPLISLIDLAEEGGDEWVSEELPHVFASIGPAAIPALSAYLMETSHPMYGAAYASNGLVEIGKMYPEVRSECVADIVRRLELFEENDEELNGFLVADLVHLHAVEAAPIIEKAFAAERVDTFIIGDWDDVQVELGLKERTEEPEKEFTLDDFLRPKLPERHLAPAVPSFATGERYLSGFPTGTSSKKGPTKKAKQKMAKQSRKKNRRKK